MKRIIVITGISLLMGLLNNRCFAQNYLGLLTNNSSKTWKLTDLNIAGKHFSDTDSTCVYQLSVTFNIDGTYSKTIPCSTTTPTKTGVFNIVTADSSLTFDGYALKITSITATQFETYYLSTVSSGINTSKKVAIIQQYQIP